MTHIKISNGLDIPIQGKPEGQVKPLTSSGEVSSINKAKSLSLNLESFEKTRFTLLAKVDESVKIGQPIVEDKSCKGRVFLSPGSGVIKEVRRGHKRRLTDIVIELDDEESHYEFKPIDIAQSSREKLIKTLKAGGMFSYIRSRPFNLLADPNKVPRSIFVKAVESAPFRTPQEMHVEGYEDQFQAGLDALAKLTDGQVHLVYHNHSSCKAFVSAKNVTHHTVEGPHPVANHSLHIQKIDPISSLEDVVWTVTALDVVSIGHLLTKGKYHIDRVISIAGPGIIHEQTGYFKSRIGVPISQLIAGRIKKGLVRFISGDPLTGKKVTQGDYLHFYDSTLTAIPENIDRKFMHFFRLGLNDYSFSKAYLSGHLDSKDKAYSFTTSLHGEPRAFVDGSLYDKVMPLAIPTMLLVKAVMAEDFDLAELLGLLEVDSEDFALPTFVCPSKIEMTEIIKQGLSQHVEEVLA